MNLALLGEYTEALPPEGRKAMARSLSLAEECARELQDLSALLHPPLLEEVGLVPAVQWIAQTFGRRTGIEVHVDAPPEQDGLPLDIKMAIFRVVQECLTNVQRHSGSPTAWVRIERGPAGVEVSVRDAGHGIQDPRTSGDGVPAGVGMIGMRERVRQVGGTLDIATGEGGTTIQARIPLPPEVS
jgi:signal transduction histidine kinase